MGAWDQSYKQNLWLASGARIEAELSVQAQGAKNNGVFSHSPARASEKANRW